MKTAIVIPVKNEREGLDRLIRSLLPQLCEKDEIIFVDAESTDGTQEILEKYKLKYQQVKVILVQNAFPGKGRNIAIQNTDADVIAQIDGGNQPAENWLKEILAPIKNGIADYVTGNIRIMPIDRYLIGKKYNMGDVYGASFYRKDRGSDKHPPAGGASVAYKRCIWENAGGFPEWMRFGSDPFFVKKVQQQGVRFTFAEKAIAYWQIGPSFWRIMERFYRYQMAGILTWKDIKKSSLRVCVHLVIVITFFLSFIIKQTWYIPASIFFLLFAKRLLKSMKIYRNRVHGKLWHNIIAFIIFLGIEPMGVLFRIAATIRGLLTVNKNRVDWEIKVKRYLSS